jgi:hypothetical protein
MIDSLIFHFDASPGGVIGLKKIQATSWLSSGGLAPCLLHSNYCSLRIFQRYDRVFTIAIIHRFSQANFP